MTKSYIELADSAAFVGVSFPAQLGCWLFGFCFGRPWLEFDTSPCPFPPLFYSFPNLRYMMDDCSLRHRNGEVPCRAH